MVLDLLLDHEVGHFVIDEDGADHLTKRLYAATKSPPVPLEDADFIIAPYGSTKGSLQRVKRGRPEYPDLSATVVYVVDAISQSNQAAIQCSLRGPGIADRMSLPVMEGFDHREILKLSAANQDFPLGIEAIFIDPTGRLMAINRSTQIHIKDASWHTSP